MRDWLANSEFRKKVSRAEADEGVESAIRLTLDLESNRKDGVPAARSSTVRLSMNGALLFNRRVAFKS